MGNDTITAVGGVRVGQAVDAGNLTGTTVALFDRPSITAVDARGGWPGTLDTDSIGMGKTFHRKHAVFLTGGDVFGLKCAFGVQKWLLEKGLASNSEPSELPGVVGANIYDLEFGRNTEKVDYERLGYEACKGASSSPVSQGNRGAGIGATVGKLRGVRHAMKGGVGSSAVVSHGFGVGALVVANSVGNVFDPRGRTVAGTRKGLRGAGFVELEDLPLAGGLSSGKGSRATTIGLVVTNLRLSHEETLKVAEMAHDGLARSIRPVHAATDGDTIFSVSTGEKDAGTVSPDLITLVGHLAALQVQKSVLNAVSRARPLAGVPSVHV